jgi:hypothetical protein
MTPFSQPQRSDAYRTREAAYWVRTMTTLLKAHGRSVRFVTDAAAYNPVSEVLAKLLQWQAGSPADVQGWHAACDLANATYNDLLGRAMAAPASPNTGRDELTGVLFAYISQECPDMDAPDQAWSAAFCALTISDDFVPALTAIVKSEVSL